MQAVATEGARVDGDEAAEAAAELRAVAAGGELDGAHQVRVDGRSESARMVELRNSHAVDVDARVLRRRSPHHQRTRAEGGAPDAGQVLHDAQCLTARSRHAPRLLGLDRDGGGLLLDARRDDLDGQRVTVGGRLGVDLVRDLEPALGFDGLLGLHLGDARPRHRHRVSAGGQRLKFEVALLVGGGLADRCIGRRREGDLDHDVTQRPRLLSGRGCVENLAGEVDLGSKVHHFLTEGEVVAERQLDGCRLAVDLCGRKPEALRGVDRRAIERCPGRLEDHHLHRVAAIGDGDLQRDRCGPPRGLLGLGVRRFDLLEVQELGWLGELTRALAGIAAARGILRVRGGCDEPVRDAREQHDRRHEPSLVESSRRDGTHN